MLESTQLQLKLERWKELSGPTPTRSLLRRGQADNRTQEGAMLPAHGDRGQGLPEVLPPPRQGPRGPRGRPLGDGGSQPRPPSEQPGLPGGRVHPHIPDGQLPRLAAPQARRDRDRSGLRDVDHRSAAPRALSQLPIRTSPRAHSGQRRHRPPRRHRTWMWGMTGRCSGRR